MKDNELSAKGCENNRNSIYNNGKKHNVKKDISEHNNKQKK